MRFVDPPPVCQRLRVGPLQTCSSTTALDHGFDRNVITPRSNHLDWSEQVSTVDSLDRWMAIFTDSVDQRMLSMLQYPLHLTLSRLPLVPGISPVSPRTSTPYSDKLPTSITERRLAITNTLSTQIPLSSVSQAYPAIDPNGNLCSAFGIPRSHPEAQSLVYCRGPP
jgi:hypothetical protein